MNKKLLSEDFLGGQTVHNLIIIALLVYIIMQMRKAVSGESEESSFSRWSGRDVFDRAAKSEFECDCNMGSNADGTPNMQRYVCDGSIYSSCNTCCQAAKKVFTVR